MALEPNCFAEILVLLFTSHMILDKLVNFFPPWFPRKVVLETN